MSIIRDLWGRITVSLLAVITTLATVGRSVAWASPAGLALKSDDTDLAPVFILGGIGIGVLVVAIAVRIMSSRGGGSD